MREDDLDWLLEITRKGACSTAGGAFTKDAGAMGPAPVTAIIIYTFAITGLVGVEAGGPEDEVILRYTELKVAWYL